MSKIVIIGEEEKDQLKCVNILSEVISGKDVSKYLSEAQKLILNSYRHKLNSYPFREFLNKCNTKNIQFVVDQSNNSIKVYCNRQVHESKPAIDQIIGEMEDQIKKSVFSKYPFKSFVWTQIEKILKEHNIDFEIDNKKKCIQVIGQVQQFVEDRIRQEARHPPKQGQEECEICFGNVSYMLQNCSHKFCEECIRNHIDTSLNSGQNVNCPSDGCNREILLMDIKQILTTDQYNHIIDSQVKKQVQNLKHPKTQKPLYIYCQTPDCPNIFEAYKRDSQQREEFLKCELCFSEYCNLEENELHESHPGLTCKAFKNQADDSSLDELVRQGVLLRCPKCKTPCEKNGGCMHMECKFPGCGCHFCSKIGCNEGFSKSSDCYDHLQKVHGGYFQ